MSNAKKYPRKFGDPIIKFFILPPVIKKNAPIEDIINPIILAMVNFSLKKIRANREMSNGDNKHTKRAGKVGPTNSIEVY